MSHFLMSSISPGNILTRRTVSRTVIPKCSSTEQVNQTTSAQKVGTAKKPPTPKGSKPAQSASSPEEIKAVRLKKAQDLREAGLEPYAYRFDRTHYTAELQETYRTLPDGVEDEAETKVAVAGRIMAKRVMGKLAFLTLRDDRGQIQLYVDRLRLNDSQPGGFDLLKGLIDVGDIVGASGTLKRTEKGELSVLATGVQVYYSNQSLQKQV
ncbi:hypothetical protein CEUSTIGMA_g6401.t1 [Chlamydomonas eustigma]|uniref:lysine--tRNA ligase n=1 Tax=Chlamydomonas eustigma TaxID=1157962 RepID=A0A250X7A2_9CHLO|nr:hypothetical protein CEUSTIGMA_g6401.t1 [Chlamydomonas eustigma]|eukprot:GAX78961.1 hypothetical protein CEUSTIGMA_g6401.t1 [Chlamydomonas eustigma]